uniref:Uncharacterized protein n=1 Tax=Romanomermis culicivorax TaxID=13658 RepID=A0A915IF62_ROMCU
MKNLENIFIPHYRAYIKCTVNNKHFRMSESKKISVRRAGKPAEGMRTEAALFNALYFCARG